MTIWFTLWVCRYLHRGAKERKSVEVELRNSPPQVDEHIRGNRMRHGDTDAADAQENGGSHIIRLNQIYDKYKYRLSFLVRDTEGDALRLSLLPRGPRYVL